MSLKLTPVANAPKNKEIKSKDYDKPTFSANVFQPYFRLGIVGSSGTGKTNAWINLFNVIEKDLDRVFILTTSLHNDPKQEAVFLGKENISTLGSLEAFSKRASLKMITPGAMTPPIQAPSFETQSKVVAVPKSTIIRPHLCFS